MYLLPGHFSVTKVIHNLEICRHVLEYYTEFKQAGTLDSSQEVMFNVLTAVRETGLFTRKVTSQNWSRGKC